MNSETKIVLGIETSCDDTSVCLLQGRPMAPLETPTILAHLSFSQESILKKWGGVVPEIAARNHMLKISPLLEECFHLAQIKMPQVDLIAITTHPGLLGPLLTGLNSAKTLALLFEKALFAVNHLYAHLEAIRLTQPVPYPYLGILVSGGHGLFVRVDSPSSFRLIGSTVDDAPGEAFDKGGKLMGLPYPAGKVIDQLAKSGDENKYAFPIGLQHSKNADLSYSGVKTFLRQMIEKNPSIIAANSQSLSDLCASYQKAIVEALLIKTPFALEMAGLAQNSPMVLGGGVACNSKLRFELKKKYPQVSIVASEFCTDNGAMVANYALLNFQQQMPFPACLKMDAHNRHYQKGG